MYSASTFQDTVFTSVVLQDLKDQNLGKVCTSQLVAIYPADVVSLNYCLTESHPWREAFVWCA
jgi:hypothetical protein